MKSLSNLIKQSTAGILFFVSLDSYRRAVINDNKVKESDRLLQDTIRKYKLAEKDLMNKEQGTCLDNVDTIAKVGRIKECIESVDQDTKQLINQASVENNKQSIVNSSQILNKSISNLTDEINKLSNKFNASDPKNNKLLDDILGSYSTAELGSIGHIFGCIFIFICL